MEKSFKRVKYITLSPLHIADGNTLSSLEYFLYNGKIHIYKSEDLKRLFNSNQLKDFIGYAINNESPSLSSFFRTYSNAEQILRVASTRSSHSLRFWGRETPSKIWTFIKSQNRVYIPGSGIKGALRTAILRKMILDNSLDSFVAKELRGIKNRFSAGNPDRRELGRELNRLEERLSGKALRLSGRNDAKFDIMKFVLVSDTYSKNVEPLVANIETKNSSRSMGDFHEIIPKDTEFKSEIAIIKGKQFEEFVGRFGDDDRRHSLFNNLDVILKASYEMSKEIIEEELNFYRRLKVNTAISQLEEIKKANTEGSPVIRIGKHQGFMSITIAELIKKHGQGAYSNYVELLKIIKGKIYPDNFPKTRKVLVNLANEELTLGWIKIEVK